MTAAEHPTATITVGGPVELTYDDIERCIDIADAKAEAAQDAAEGAA